VSTGENRFAVTCSDCGNIIYSFKNYEEFRQFDAEKEKLNGLLIDDFKIGLKKLSEKYKIPENNILTCPCHMREKDGKIFISMGKI